MDRSFNMNKDDIKVLTFLYNTCKHSVVSYVLLCSLYFESDREEKEGIANLSRIKEELDKLAAQIQDLCIKNKLTLTLGTYKEEYTELNYLSYKFIKNYVKNELKNDIDEIENLVSKVVTVNSEVNKIAKKYINFISNI